MVRVEEKDPKRSREAARVGWDGDELSVPVKRYEDEVLELAEAVVSGLLVLRQVSV